MIDRQACIRWPMRGAGAWLRDNAGGTCRPGGSDLVATSRSGAGLAEETLANVPARAGLV
jgi:hypothetical protein